MSDVTKLIDLMIALKEIYEAAQLANIDETHLANVIEQHYLELVEGDL